jgi:hypothetical protein
MAEEKGVKRKRGVDLYKKILVSRGMTEDEALAAAEEIETKGNCTQSGNTPIF